MASYPALDLNHRGAMQPQWQVSSLAGVWLLTPIPASAMLRCCLYLLMMQLRTSTYSCVCAPAFGQPSSVWCKFICGCAEPLQRLYNWSATQNHVGGGGDVAAANLESAGSPDYEGASMAPLTLPLDLSAAPSLSLPEAPAPAGLGAAANNLHQQQAQQEQQPATVPAERGADDERSRGNSPAGSGVQAAGQASSGEASKRSSLEGDARPRNDSLDRPRTPPEPPGTPDEHLQQQQRQQEQAFALRRHGHAHLVPVVDQRLDTWPPASRSPTQVRSAAQQIAQWQQAQQQQQHMGSPVGAPAQWQQVCVVPHRAALVHPRSCHSAANLQAVKHC